MEGFVTEDYWNYTGVATNLFTDDDEDISINSDLIQTDIDVLSKAKTFTMLPLHSLISQSDLDKVICDTRQEITYSPSINECISRLFFGKPCNLHSFKGLQQKLELLKKAVNTHDGNVILTVILFLESTLNFNLFLQKLTTEKVAVDQYCNYLLKKRDFDKLNAIQMIANEYFDMSDLFYISIKDKGTNEETKSKLDRHMNEYIASSGYIKNILTNYRTFLDYQIRRKLFFFSVSELLAHKIKDNLEGRNSLDVSDINEYANLLKISDFQLDWIKFNVVTALSMWDKFREMYIVTSLFSDKKSISSVVNKELIIMNVYKRHAPKYILEEILSAMPADELTLHWAQKVKCHKYIMDYYSLKKDRTALLEYKANFPPTSDEYLYAESLLKLENADKRKTQGLKFNLKL